GLGLGLFHGTAEARGLVGFVTPVRQRAGTLVGQLVVREALLGQARAFGVQLGLGALRLGLLLGHARATLGVARLAFSHLRGRTMLAGDALAATVELLLLPAYPRSSAHPRQSNGEHDEDECHDDDDGDDCAGGHREPPSRSKWG